MAQKYLCKCTKQHNVIVIRCHHKSKMHLYYYARGMIFTIQRIRDYRVAISCGIRELILIFSRQNYETLFLCFLYNNQRIQISTKFHANLN